MIDKSGSLKKEAQKEKNRSKDGHILRQKKSSKKEREKEHADETK